MKIVFNLMVSECIYMVYILDYESYKQKKYTRFYSHRAFRMDMGLQECSHFLHHYSNGFIIDLKFQSP